MTAADIVEELKGLGSESTKKVLLKHGAKEPFYGVKIEDLKKVQKRIKTNHQLALDLYDTGISDAMYLAGLIADDGRMTKKDLQRWAEKAPWSLIGEYTVAWVAAGGPHGRELALEWIEAERPNMATIGWSTLTSLVAIKPDEELNVAELKKLLKRIETTMHKQPDRIRYVMNAFVIALACYVAPLTEAALQTAGKIGKVSADMGATACKVPSAVEYIKKVQERGTIGKKRKSAKC